MPLCSIRMSLPPGETPPPTRIPPMLGSYYALTLHSCALLAAFFNPRLAVALWVFALTTPMFEAWVRRVNAPR